MLLGNGDGTFKTVVSYPTGDGPLGITLGDLNADGFLDLVTGNQTDGSVSALLGRGNGTFATALTITGLGMTQGVAIGDFNKDNRPDIAAANPNNSRLSVLLSTAQ